MARLHSFVITTLLAIVIVAPFASGEVVATVDLGTAEDFAILAGAGITNTGHSTVRGDVGSHPTSSQTGFGAGGANSVTLVGTNHHDDAVTVQAKVDLVTAYNDAAGRPDPTPIAGELGGLTLTPGVYADNNAPDSLAITGTLTLDGQGDPDSVFIFQSGSTLITASDSRVVLTNGTQSCNVFWQVSSSATLGTRSHLEGTILALTSITLGTDATVDGRVLARNGAVTMQSNTIQIEACAVLPPTPTPTPTPSPSPSPSPTPSPSPSPSPPPTTTPTTSPTMTPTTSPTMTPTTSPTMTPTNPTMSPTFPTPSPTPTPIPVFPSAAAMILAALAAMVAVLMVVRRRRP